MMIPEAFQEEMRELWQRCRPPGTLCDFFDSFSEPPRRGLLLNAGKLSLREAEEILPREAGFHPVPWASWGKYCPDSFDAGHSPYFRAGLFYIQDPAAMLPAALADIRGDEKILDLCAAPGGKSVAVATKLGRQGSLLANEKSARRALALCRNLEICGATASSVCVHDAMELPALLKTSFDLVLLDAPCSGSAMFRKDETARKSWARFRGADLLRTQAALLDAAASLTRAGGRLIYSSCSFSFDENEEQILRFLERHPDFCLLPRRPNTASPGLFRDASEAFLQNCVRIWPHCSDGEGQFAALLERRAPTDHAAEEQADAHAAASRGKKSERTNAGRERAMAERALAGFMQRNLHPSALMRHIMDEGNLRLKDDRLYWTSACSPHSEGVYYLKTGIFLGRLRRDHRSQEMTLHPSQAFLMTLPGAAPRNSLSLRANSRMIARCLKGESLGLDLFEKALQDGEIDGEDAVQQLNRLAKMESGDFACILLHKWPLIWCRRQGRQFKNLFPSGWIQDS